VNLGELLEVYLQQISVPLSFGYIAHERQNRRDLFGYATYMLTLRNGVRMSKFRIPALNSLRVFESVARLQSITQACTELHITHAAVSRHIQKVEQNLGRDLFERHHRKIVLNDDGESLLRAVTAAFSQIQRAIAYLSRHQNPERLTISVDPDFAALWLVPRLAEFNTIAPNILVEIIAEKGLRFSEDPRIDCAIQYAKAGSELENGEVLFRSHLFPVCAPESARTPALRSPEDLRGRVLVHDRTTAEWREYIQSRSPPIDVDPTLGVIFSETLLCHEAAARGQGIAMGDDFLAEMQLSEGHLVRPFDASFPSKNAYYFIIPERDARHPGVSAFRAWLFQTVERVRKKTTAGRPDGRG
jgi:LysR family glycine cleavage system transcriptional activator